MGIPVPQNGSAGAGSAQAEEPGPRAAEELAARLRDIERRVAALAAAVEARQYAPNGASPPPAPPRGARVVVVRSPPPAIPRPGVHHPGDYAATPGERRASGAERRQGPRDRRRRRRDRRAGEGGRRSGRGDRRVGGDRRVPARRRRLRVSPMLLAWLAQLVTFAAIVGAALASR